ncbi:unnamed protein product [Calicophoron daubneyi]|uniref:Uncharacterized protein n=1 Tax=Calicophoron daubneyi TaxID=300641 RepID=A0AAV2TDC1_CALDB
MELVDDNTVGRNGQFAVEARRGSFGSAAPSGSSDDILIWSTGAAEFDPNDSIGAQLRNSSHTHYNEVPFSSSYASSVPTYSAAVRSSSTKRCRSRRTAGSCFLDITSERSVPETASSRSLSCNAAISPTVDRVPVNHGSNHDNLQQWLHNGFRQPETQGPTDDFIELDLCSRSITYSDGDESEDERNPVIPTGRLHTQTPSPQPTTSSRLIESLTLHDKPASSRIPCPQRNDANCTQPSCSSQPHCIIACPTSAPVQGNNSVCDSSGGCTITDNCKCVGVLSTFPTPSTSMQQQTLCQTESPRLSLRSDSPQFFQLPLISSSSSSSSSVYNISAGDTEEVVMSTNHCSSSCPWPTRSAPEILVSQTVDVDPSCSSQNSTIAPTSPSARLADLGDLPLMLMPASELAVGDSLTCTVVNILRGLRLLDRCGLEDLCASLYGLRASNVCVRSPQTIDNSSCATPRDPPTPEEPSVTRSSSFTSATLVSPRHRTIPQSGFRSDDICSSTLDKKVKERLHCGCIVNYILACSYCGSGLLPVHVFTGRTAQSNSGKESSNQPYGPSPHITFRNACSFKPLHRGGDWRRGGADNLVNLLISGPLGIRSSRTPVNRLLTGRFLAGPKGWRDVWPTVEQVSAHRRRCSPGLGLKEDLIEWLSAWIRRGAVPVLAQLADTHEPDTKCPDDWKQVASELIWRHRIVFGIGRNNTICLSNPVELVSADYVLQQLSRKTVIKIEKSQLASIWADHSPSIATDDALVTDAAFDHESTEGSVIKFQTHCSCVEDFSNLAQQSDPRWNSLNILGQVLSTLRSLENDSTKRCNPFVSNGQTSSFQVERSSLSPVIVIPSSQVSGFSVFVPKSDWDLVHILFHCSSWCS